MSAPNESRQVWQAILFGALLILSLGVGGLVEFIAGTWYPGAGVGLLRLYAWAIIATVLWFVGSMLPRAQRVLAVGALIVLLIIAYASPWPAPRKQFFRDMASLDVGMSEAAVKERVATQHLCTGSEVEYWLRYHIARVRKDTTRPVVPTYLVLTPSSYNGIIGDSDHCLVTFTSGVVSEVVACID